ncbi:MAG: type II secretion system protein GspJ [Vibrio splendidus]
MKSDRGLSLIELVVAMAVFSMVAIMGLQSLTGMLRSRDHLVAVDEATHDLGYSISLLRHDLSSIVPMLFYHPDRRSQESSISLRDNNTHLSFSVGGQPTRSDESSIGTFHRSEWKLELETGTLTRGVWPTLIPAEDDVREPDVLMLKGIDAIEARSFWPDIGWVEGLGAPNGANQFVVDEDQSGLVSGTTSVKLPLAVEITLLTRDFGAIPIIQSLR